MEAFDTFEQLIKMERRGFFFSLFFPVVSVVSWGKVVSQFCITVQEKTKTFGKENTFCLSHLITSLIFVVHSNKCECVCFTVCLLHQVDREKVFHALVAFTLRRFDARLFSFCRDCYPRSTCLRVHRTFRFPLGSRVVDSKLNVRQGFQPKLVM